MSIDTFYKQFCKEEFDENGRLTAFEPVVPENFNFAYDVVDALAAIEPEKQAMVWCNDEGEERFFSFADVEKYSNQAANLFKSKGVKKGDMVMLVLKRHYQFWFAVLGLHKLGAIAIPATHLLTKKDFVYRFESAEVSHIVCTAEPSVLDAVEDACQTYTGLKNRFVVGTEKEGWLNFDAELAQQPTQFTRIDTKADEALLLYFTSGTTGQPKMVFHDHSYPIAHIVTAKYWHNLSPESLHLTVSETGWAKSVWGKLYGQWFVGAAVFVYDMEKFVPAELLKRIAQYHVTSFCAPPTIYRFFVKGDMPEFDFSSVKYATTAGEALNAEVFQQFYNKTGLKLMEAYGQTETTVITLNLPGTDPVPGSMGKPSPLYQVELVDDTGAPVPPGEVGELVLRVPEGEKQIGLYRGYHKNKELTRSVWRDGYYHTGDTAWRDENGLYWYVGRTDDIIKASGYRIGPFEIESVLMQHPAVLECAITGAPDPIRGTVVKATIVLTKSHSPSDALKKELQEFVKKQTAPYKYPRVVEFVEELPKTISGKIRRAEIRGQKD